MEELNQKPFCKKVLEENSKARQILLSNFFNLSRERLLRLLEFLMKKIAEANNHITIWTREQEFHTDTQRALANPSDERMKLLRKAFLPHLTCSGEKEKNFYWKFGTPYRR